MHVHREHLLWVVCDHSLVVAGQVNKTKRTVQIMKKRTHATHVAWLRRDPTSAWPIYQDLLLVICAITQRKRGDNKCIWTAVLIQWAHCSPAVGSLWMAIFRCQSTYLSLIGHSCGGWALQYLLFSFSRPVDIFKTARLPGRYYCILS